MTATLHQVCKLSGIAWTITDCHTASRFQTASHPNWNHLHNEVSKYRWKCPKPYIVGSIFQYLTLNSLATNPETEEPILRATLSATLCTLPASKLYYLHQRMYASKAPMAHNPIRVALSTLLGASATAIFATLLTIAEQQMSKEDYLAIRSTTLTGTSNKRNKRKTVRLAKTRMSPTNVYTRLSKQLAPLHRELIAQQQNVPSSYPLPSWCTTSTVRKAAQYLPLYSGLSPASQKDTLKVLKAVFESAIHSNLVDTKDDILGQSYFWFTNMAKQNLVNTKSTDLDFI